MGDVFGDDDGDFPTDLWRAVDELVDKHQKQLPAVPGSSQVFPPHLSPEHSAAQQSRQVQVHRLYGPLDPVASSSTAAVHQQPCQAGGQHNRRLQVSAVHQPRIAVGASPTTFPQAGWQPPTKSRISPGVLASIPSPGPLYSPILPALAANTAAMQQRPAPLRTSLRDRFGRKEPPTGRWSGSSGGPNLSALAGSQTAPQPSSGVRQTLLQAQLDGLPEDSRGIAGPTASTAEQPQNAEQHLAFVRQRLGSQEGTISIVRAKLEAAEKEKVELQQKLAHLTTVPSQHQHAGAPFQAEWQRQLETVNQQLAFKEQELLEERRRHADFTERVRAAEQRANQLQTEMRNLEAVHFQMQQELDAANRERRLRAADASVPPGTPTSKSKRCPAVKRTATGTPIQPLPAAFQSSSQLKHKSSPPRSAVDMRSVGTNTAAESPVAGPPAWEVPSLQLQPTANSSVLQGLWAEAGDHLPILMSDNRNNSRAAPNSAIKPDASRDHVGPSCAIEDSAALIAVRQQVRRLAWSDDSSLDLLVDLASLIAEGRKHVRSLSKQQAGGTPFTAEVDSRASFALQEELQQPSARAPQCLVSLQQLSAGLYILAGLLNCSQDAGRAVIASCRNPPEASEAPAADPDAEEGASRSAALKLPSGSAVFRYQPAQKPRPPDQQTVNLLGSLAKPAEVQAYGQGLLSLLLHLQADVNRHELDRNMLPVEEGLLAALNSLISSADTDLCFMLPVARSGLLDQVADEQHPQLSRALLEILGVLVGERMVCKALLESHLNSLDCMQTDEAADYSHRTRGCLLLEVPLLCISAPLPVDQPPDEAALAPQRAAIAALAQLIELRHFELLLHLLTEHPGSGTAPPLAQRLIFLASELLDCCGGEVLPESRPAPIGSAELAQCLRVLQEALLLIRSLLGEAATAAAVVDDLTSNSTAQRICLALNTRLVEWEPLQDESAQPEHISEAAIAPWAVALGAHYTARPFYSFKGQAPTAAINEIMYLAKSVRRRVLHRIEGLQA